MSFMVINVTSLGAILKDVDAEPGVESPNTR